MAARAIGTATVSFGLVSVPVKLYSSSDSTGTIRFNWIHKDCGSRLKQQYLCATEGVVVERDDMVKGYEFAKDQYVLFEPDELKAIEEVGDNTIAIEEFVPFEQVERLYLDKVYYLGPDKGGDRAYRLLSEAMRKTGLSAVARHAARGKQYLVMVRPLGDGLVMEQLHYANEIRSFDEVPVGNGKVKDAEVKLAVQFIEQAASDEFRPEKYEDEVRGRVQELIQQKIEGEDITVSAAEAPQAQIIDLMQALKASLAQSEGGAKAGGRKPAKASSSSKKKPARKKASSSS